MRTTRGSGPGLLSAAISSCFLAALATAYSLTYGYAAAHVGSEKIWPDVPLNYFILFAAFYGVSLPVSYLLTKLTKMDGEWAYCVSGGIVLFTFQLVGRTVLIPADVLSVAAYTASGFVIGFLVATLDVGINRLLRWRTVPVL